LLPAGTTGERRVQQQPGLGSVEQASRDHAAIAKILLGSGPAAGAGEQRPRAGARGDHHRHPGGKIRQRPGQPGRDVTGAQGSDDQAVEAFIDALEELAAVAERKSDQAAEMVPPRVKTVTLRLARPTQLVLAPRRVGSAELVLPGRRAGPAQLVFAACRVGSAERVSRLSRVRPAPLTCHPGPSRPRLASGAALSPGCICRSPFPCQAGSIRAGSHQNRTPGRSARPRRRSSRPASPKPASAAHSCRTWWQSL
jgi:hypothetical protein